MGTIGLTAIYQRPKTSKPSPGHKLYPYLLRGMDITRPNQVWAADVTYVPMARGFLYLVAIMDWHSRHVVDWPAPLREAIEGFTYMVHGGHEFDGRDISTISVSEVAAAAKEMQRHGVKAVAVSGVFSPVNPAHETETAAVISREAPSLRITLSHENGRIGLLERENAAVLNACLGDVAVRTIKGIQMPGTPMLR